jgi:hypothetical protein
LNESGKKEKPKIKHFFEQASGDPQSRLTDYEKEVAGIRLNSAIAAENSDLLVFNRIVYEKIFLDDMESELHDRIQVLNRLRLFEKADPMILSPLASFLETEVYKMG